MRHSDVTPQMIRLMNPEDQERFGFFQPGVHPPYAQDHHAPVKTGKLEKHEQNTFWNWLCLNGYEPGAIWHRMDRATGATRGTPDFVIPIWGPERVLYIEFKVPGSWLSESQEKFRAGLENKGHDLYVCYSSAEAIALVKQKDRLV